MGRKPNTDPIQLFLDRSYSHNGHIYAVDEKGNGWTYVINEYHRYHRTWRASHIVADHYQEWLQRGDAVRVTADQIPSYARIAGPYGT